MSRFAGRKEPQVIHVEGVPQIQVDDDHLVEHDEPVQVVDHLAAWSSGSPRLQVEEDLEDWSRGRSDVSHPQSRQRRSYGRSMIEVADDVHAGDAH